MAARGNMIVPTLPTLNFPRSGPVFLIIGGTVGTGWIVVALSGTPASVNNTLLPDTDANAQTLVTVGVPGGMPPIGTQLTIAGGAHSRVWRIMAYFTTTDMNTAMALIRSVDDPDNWSWVDQAVVTTNL